MASTTSIKIIEELKGNNLKLRLNELKNSIVMEQARPDLCEVYKAALEIKKLSAQIDEIVHATGIIQCLPKILLKGEIVVKISLASGGGIDLLTNKRVAEFKFARWQDKSANGARTRGVFADLVSIYLYNDTKLKKELYVMDQGQVVAFLETSNSSWREKLSKHKRVLKAFEDSLERKNISSAHTVCDVYRLIGHNVEIHDIELL